MSLKTYLKLHYQEFGNMSIIFYLGLDLHFILKMKINVPIKSSSAYCVVDKFPEKCGICPKLDGLFLITICYICFIFLLLGGYFGK